MRHYEQQTWDMYESLRKLERENPENMEIRKLRCQVSNLCAEYSFCDEDTDTEARKVLEETKQALVYILHN